MESNFQCVNSCVFKIYYVESTVELFPMRDKINSDEFFLILKALKDRMLPYYETHK